jgi:hypothetical protein
LVASARFGIAAAQRVAVNDGVLAAIAFTTPAYVVAPPEIRLLNHYQSAVPVSLFVYFRWHCVPSLSIDEAMGIVWLILF